MSTLNDLHRQDPDLRQVVINKEGMQRFQARRHLPVAEGDLFIVLEHFSVGEENVYQLAFDELELEVKGSRNYWELPGSERK